MPLHVIHKLQYGIKLRYRELPKVEGIRDLRIADAVEAYIEVESPIDQNRIMGEPPRPWAKEPRYAWILCVGNDQLHIAGWLRERDPAYTGEVYRFRVIDLYVPWRNVLSMQVIQHKDWEGKEDADKPANA